MDIGSYPSSPTSLEGAQLRSEAGLCVGQTEANLVLMTRLGEGQRDKHTTPRGGWQTGLGASQQPGPQGIDSGMPQGCCGQGGAGAGSPHHHLHLEEGPAGRPSGEEAGSSLLCVTVPQFHLSPARPEVEVASPELHSGQYLLGQKAWWPRLGWSLLLARVPI